MDILEHSHVFLRALEPEDLELLYSWENNPGVWHLSGTLVPYSRYVLKQYLENAGKDIFEMKQLRLVIELRKEGTTGPGEGGSGRAVGAIDLFDFDPFHRRAGVGILIAHPSDRGKGYAREALEALIDYSFSVLKLHQLWCNISAGNEESIRLFKAAGFTRAGIKKEWIFNGEGFEDEVLMQYIKKG